MQLHDALPNELHRRVAARLEERAVRLDAFLYEGESQPWEWGRVDCTMLCADWIFQETGKDPACEFRGAYTSGEEALRMIKRAGGFMPMIGEAMDSCGFARTQEPQVGDVGLVNAPIALRDRLPVVQTISAIRGRGGLWIVRALRGTVYDETLPTVTAWRI